jgi:branched-chain amino acid aminotransferase
MPASNWSPASSGGKSHEQPTRLGPYPDACFLVTRGKPFLVARGKPFLVTRRKPRSVLPMTEGLAFVEGRIVDLQDARVPLNDRGFLLGDGIFETLRTSNGHLFRLEDHMARVRLGLKAIGLEPEVQDLFREAVASLAKAGAKRFGGELYLRVNLSTGPMDDVAGSDMGITVTGLVKKFKPYPMQYYANGVQVVLSKQRKDTRNPLSGIKSLSFLPYVTARREAHTATAHDAILLNEHGRIAEASTSNVFALKAGKVHAPGAEEGAIAGVTRAAVLELIEEAGLAVEPRLTVADLEGAEEAWLSNTTGGIVPITRFQDRAVGGGRKGEFTTQLMHALETEIRGNHHA